MRRTEITIPASTSNLGASFDAVGLALALYLRVTVEEAAESFIINPTGEGAAAVERGEANLMALVARFVAAQRGHAISGARLTVASEIPLARGLGSSSSAIIAGISVYETLSGERLSDEEIFRYALHFEGHGDNLAPSLLGGLVVACVVADDDNQTLATVKRPWPEAVKIVLAVPDYEMSTAEMRRALPQQVPLADAAFNVQRAALLQAVISERRFEWLSEALRDRLHQPHRAPYGPGLSAALELNNETREHPGLLGVAISGAGSTVIAFANNHFAGIAALLEARLASAGVRARTLTVAVDNRGRVVESIEP
ncbi:MAG TPA: homoserine kinase [Blastocatellia bacterium]|nr:homoserine kinase [Blastocatellia bacterium]